MSDDPITAFKEYLESDKDYPPRWWVGDGGNPFDVQASFQHARIAQRVHQAALLKVYKEMFPPPQAGSDPQ